MTYTHHFILQSVNENGLLAKDMLESLPFDRALSCDVHGVEKHWTEQYGTPMIVTNVYVTEDL